MATVTDSATGDVYEGVTGAQLDYYRGEGARFSIVEDAGVVSLPRTFVDGAEQADPEPEKVSEGTGEPMTAVEVAPGETGTVSNVPESHPSPRKS